MRYKNIEAERARNGMTKEKFATSLGVSVSTLKNWQNGKTEIPATLPDFESLTETLSGPGILGEIDDPTVGHFQSMEIEIPFRQMDKDLFILSDDISSVTVTLRGSIQYTVNDSGATAFKPMRIVVRGKNKGLTGGKAKQGSGTASSIKLEILYILIEIDNVTEIELDNEGMTEAQARQKVVGIMQGWIGLKRSDRSHAPIIDTYNGNKPLPRGYKVTYTDAYCATTTSAAAIKAGYTDIIPVVVIVVVVVVKHFCNTYG